MHARTAILVIGIVSTHAIAQPLISDFDSGIDGWSVETRTNPSGSFSLVGSYTPGFVASGGDPGGYLEEVDPDGQWSFFVSPVSWAGDRSGFLGRRLVYSTRTNVNDFPDGRLVILVGAGGQEISHDAGVPGTGVWTRREIDLSEGSWFVGTFADGAPASEALIGSVLADLEKVYIGLEFGSDTAEERVGLDSVGFGLCEVDLDNSGALNFGDVTAFLTLYGMGDLRVDLDGSGTLNFGDVTAFLTFYGMGCP